jgi:flagellar protein FlgJ
MHDQQLSLDLASRGGIGLAEVLVEQLRSDRGAIDKGDGASGSFTLGQQPVSGPGMDVSRYWQAPVTSPAPAPLPLAKALSPASMPSSAAVDTAIGDSAWSPASPGEFAARLRPVAEDAARQLGVDPDLLLAQAALETGWGRHITADQRGSSNNFFNIKAGPDWDGPTVTVQTVEYRDGVAVRESARFRAYESAAESFADYAALIEDSPRYSNARGMAADGEQYLRELQRAGYATDPAYADKILSILARNDLAGAQADLKNTADRPLSL